MVSVHSRTQDDWVNSFCTYTEGIPSPALFRKWTAISAVAGLLERRVYTETSQTPLYPNMYILLVARPAVGKSVAINQVGKVWRQMEGLFVAPDNVTRASLIDALKGATRIVQTPKETFLYNHLNVVASEFGVLVPAHDLEFLNILNHLYDAPEKYHETRRTKNSSVEITHPCLNVLAGTQPAYLYSLLPEEAWGMGFTSRLLMVYSDKPVRTSLFKKRKIDEKLFDGLVKDAKHIFTLTGEYRWSPEVEDEIDRWHSSGMAPIPSHSRLTNYIPRRVLHLLKLCMISTASRSDKMVIEMPDFLRAKEWLLEAEKFMPDIFREMGGKSDGQMLQDLHAFAWDRFVRSGKEPIPKRDLVAFLSVRVPSERVGYILRNAIDGGLFVPDLEDPNSFIPRTDLVETELE